MAETQLQDAINKVWFDLYQGEPVTDTSALVNRIRNIADDRNCWLFNAKVLQKQVNELTSKTSTQPHNKP